MRNSPQDAGTIRRLARAVLLFGSFLAAALAVILGMFAWVERSEIEIPEIGLTAAAVLRNSIERIDDDPTLPRVVVLGDSTVMSYPLNQTVTARLNEALRRRMPSVVLPLAVPGLGPFEYFYASRAIGEKHPDVVVLAFNPACLAQSWGNRFSRPQVAGLLKPAQIPHALTLPLHYGRVTTDRLLSYVATLQLGGFDLWYSLAEQQARIAPAHRAAARWLSEAVGMSSEERFANLRMLRQVTRYRIDGKQRFTEWAVERHYGVFLAGQAAEHPALEMLGAAIHELESSNVSTLTYLVPINVEHFESLGLVDPAQLRSSVDAVEAVVRVAGGEFIDLHDIFEDRGFRDGAGHFAIDPEFDGPAWVAARLRGRIETLVKRSVVPD